MNFVFQVLLVVVERHRRTLAVLVGMTAGSPAAVVWERGAQRETLIVIATIMTDREGNSPEMNAGEDMQRETAVTTEKEVTDKQKMFLLLGDSNLSCSRVTLNLDHLCLNNQSCYSLDAIKLLSEMTEYDSRSQFMDTIK